MKPYLRVVSGARTGMVLPLEGTRVSVGRRAGCEMRFDPEEDLEVSGDHAELDPRDDGWWVRDLESRNGTWVNGERVEGERRLAIGDVLSFGAHGPRVEFRDADEDAGLPTRQVAAQAEGARAAEVSPELVSSASPGEPSRDLSPLGYLLALLLGIGLASLIFLSVYPASPDSELLEERERLGQMVDSLLLEGDRVAEALEGEMEGLESALRASQAEVRRIQEELGRQEQNTGPDRDREREELEQRLLAATTALQRQQLAASLDFSAIEAMNRRAVALVYVESEAGQVSTGTAFSVRPDGTLVTSLHILEGPEGDQAPRRIGVQFSDSEQVWPARVLASSRESTLAVLKVDNIAGDVPTVRRLNPRPDTLSSGVPLALIGYPLGGDLSGVPGSGTRVARPLTIAGVLSRNGPDFMEIQGHGDQGASGSPIFDGTGAVVAVLYGGRPGEVQPVLLAVSSLDAIQLLDRVSPASP